MTKRLDLGGGLLLPALDAQTQTMVVYGGKGMGKTNLGSVFAEELANAGLRFSWLDPYGVAWGLKYSADGKGPGLPVLKLGGQKADLRLVPTTRAAESAADLVVDEDVSVLIDISRHADGKMWSNGERIRFVRDYCNHLFMRQGERRRPLMQIIDECGRFAPQLPPRGAVDIAECLGSIEQLCEIGRNVGVGVCLITQRSARMNKSVSELAEMMVAFRTVGPNSIDAIMDWFGEHVPKARQKELIESVRALPRGTALVVSPGWLGVEGEYAIRARQTFDSSETPRAGQTRRVSGKPAHVDRDKYAARMAEIEEQAEARDPAALTKQVKELERALRDAKSAKPQVERVEVQDRELAQLVRRMRKAVEEAMKFIVQVNVHELGDSLTDSDRASLQKAVEAAVNTSVNVLDGKLAQRAKAFEQVKRQGQRVLRELKALAEGDVEVKVDVRQQDAFVVEPPPARPAPATRGPRSAEHGSQNGEVSRPMQTVLDALAWLAQVGQAPARRTAVALVAGYSHTSGGFNNLLGSLRTRGLIDYPQGGTVALTDAGEQVASVMDVVGEDELREMVYKRVGPSKSRVLNVLVELYPNAISREDLAEQTGYSATSGGFNNLLGSLRTVGLLDYPQKGYVVATDALFIEGAAS